MAGAGAGEGDEGWRGTSPGWLRLGAAGCGAQLVADVFRYALSAEPVADLRVAIVVFVAEALYLPSKLRQECAPCLFIRLFSVDVVIHKRNTDGGMLVHYVISFRGGGEAPCGGLVAFAFVRRVTDLAEDEQSRMRHRLRLAALLLDLGWSKQRYAKFHRAGGAFVER